jgi:hypothetical protein
LDLSDYGHCAFGGRRRECGARRRFLPLTLSHVAVTSVDTEYTNAG